MTQTENERAGPATRHSAIEAMRRTLFRNASTPKRPYELIRWSLRGVAKASRRARAQSLARRKRQAPHSRPTHLELNPGAQPAFRNGK